MYLEDLGRVPLTALPARIFRFYIANQDAVQKEKILLHGTCTEFEYKQASCLYPK